MVQVVTFKHDVLINPTLHLKDSSWTLSCSFNVLLAENGVDELAG